MLTLVPLTLTLTLVRLMLATPVHATRALVTRNLRTRHVATQGVATQGVATQGVATLHLVTLISVTSHSPSRSVIFSDVQEASSEPTTALGPTELRRQTRLGALTSDIPASGSRAAFLLRRRPDQRNAHRSNRLRDPVLGQREHLLRHR
jgi:hypothetical protein